MVSHPSARELPGTSVRVMKVRSVDGLASTEAPLMVCSAARANDADRPGGAEQSGMPGDAAERPGVLVVHFADQRTAAPWVVFGRGRALAPGPRWMKVSGSSVTYEATRRNWAVSDADGSGRAGPSTGRAAARILEDEAEQNVAEVGVDRAGARRVLQRRVAIAGLELGASGEVAEVRKVRGQSRTVGQQIAQGHVGAIGAAPLGNPQRRPGPRVAGCHRPRRASPASRLQMTLVSDARSKIGVGWSFRRPVVVGESAERLLPGTASRASDFDRRGGKGARCDGASQTTSAAAPELGHRRSRMTRRRARRRATVTGGADQRVPGPRGRAGAPDPAEDRHAGRACR